MASSQWGKRALSGLVGLCTAVPVVATFRHYFVNIAFVDGTSMQPTLCDSNKGDSTTDLVLINRMAKVRGQFSRGDVVALWYSSVYVWWCYILARLLTYVMCSGLRCPIVSL